MHPLQCAVRDTVGTYVPGNSLEQKAVLAQRAGDRNGLTGPPDVRTSTLALMASRKMRPTALLIGLASATALTPRGVPPSRSASKITQLQTTSSRLPLAVLSAVPVAFGCYATAVQLAGELTSSQAMMLQCGTYIIAGTSICAMRKVREGSFLRVSMGEWHAGLELGLWIFCGATLQSLGLQLTTATRAGFLVRLSTVLVPLAESFLSRRLLGPKMMAAVVCSVIGVVTMVLSPDAGAAAAAGLRIATWQGDALIACSALFYTGHILRLGRLAPKYDPWPLATVKSTTQIIGSLATLAFLQLRSRAAGAMASPVPPVLLPIVLFTGVVTCAFPMWAQGYGQQRVKPSHASLIYATAPVWNALIAALVLGQHLTPRAMAGAVMMMVGMALSIWSATQEEGQRG